MHEFKRILLAAAAALGLPMTEAMCDRFFLYYRLLIEWNEKFNLTSLVDLRDVVVKHFIDSLTCLLIYNPVAGARLIDIGAGAGFPGLPVKIVCEDLRCTLIESSAKKAVFLRHVTASLDLADVEVACGRAEELAHRVCYRACFDLALARAVAPLPVLLEYALPFLKIGGFFIALKGPAVHEELPACGNALNVLGGSVKEVKTVFLPITGDMRKLVVVEKTGPTPAKYPRRPGVPQRRPL
ncbi:16S rRNA (guanine(527)-N(7))-methyltransferase RsmG [Desulfofundulus thermosubterraneus]|uniref:Ribosomal RNA small subunit methyltransferase G n=1 Tax=Desulfofundulus thermosubterraneus DSM 16057 TaxID=1121432 RepID=A0A1M6D275_9FIRM|nr:16S rRNA (guanine(527)-N(7))-methyltransferase RsmG [Desulfofundulus thermosubterraneus]SHI67346.1 16S rRNA (guanine527-N7)-methyltransferase [Desulfofundulus thermosubterraneus DSM 16057]